ncbi:PGF-CTERM sorting domain-containing protein [Halarchaeum salinum]|uniref:PGF-CTERM archaeal protein-sorting signal domain-containing protein n=1 Tax=Halarchaeum salinum TaxID=489912 RepID=A0AAV3S8A3_9EURY
MTSRISRSIIAALLALTVVVGASGLAAAANTATISAEPSTPGDVSTHTVTETVGSTLNTSSWNGFAVDYTDTGADASNVSAADVQTIGIDRDGNASGAAVDVNVSDDLSDVSVSNNGGTVTFNLGGSYSLYADDEVVLVYDNVTNPDATGSYNVTADINPQSSGSEATTSLTIENATTENETTTTTSTTTTNATTSTTTTNATTSTTTTNATTSTTTTNATTSTTTTNETTSTTTTNATTSTTEETSTSTSTAEESSTSSTEETSSGSSPGFGVGLALVALAGAALVAARKR